MKIPVTLKDPDSMPDAVAEALKRLPKPDGITTKEWVEIRDERADDIANAITSAFMRFGEYLDVVFDVNEDTLAVTVTVAPADG